MGDREKASLRLQFNPQIRLEFHGATITSDAGLLAFRELDTCFSIGAAVSLGRDRGPVRPVPSCTSVGLEVVRVADVLGRDILWLHWRKTF